MGGIIGQTDYMTFKLSLNWVINTTNGGKNFPDSVHRLHVEGTVKQSSMDIT